MTARSTPSRPTYRERLTVTWWVWPMALAVAGVLAAELAIGAMALRHPLTFVVACALAAAGLFAVGRIPIRVEPGDPDRGGGFELRVDDARLPLEFVASVDVIGPAQRRDLLGRDADPLAFVIARPWVPGGVRIDLADPSDPTPYWFVSTRRPAELAAALCRARNSAASPTLSRAACAARDPCGPPRPGAASPGG